MHDADAASPVSPRSRRRGARDALVVVGLAAVLLLASEGTSIRDSAKQMAPGPKRAAVTAVGTPAGWLADRLLLDELSDDATAWLDADDDETGLAQTGAPRTTAASAPGGVPPVTPDAFDPRDLGEPVAPPRPLRRLLVTGDSMAMPLDATLAQEMAGGDVSVVRDPHVGTGLSKSELVDWSSLATQQAREERADAVVVFVGANEGFPMRAAGDRVVSCCGAPWAAELAYRAREMMNAYRREGAARVYWLTLPLPRDGERARIARVVNVAVNVAAAAYRAQVRVVDMERLFTPGRRYRDAMRVGGRPTLVRDADGIHLNGAGAEVAAAAVLRALRADFDVP